MTDRHPIEAFAMAQAGLTEQEYEEQSDHPWQCRCDPCEKHRDFLRIQKIICDWNRFLDERKKT